MALEARIRELEAIIDHNESSSELAIQLVKLEDRIAKAKAILTDPSMKEWNAVDKALEALEGE